MIRISGLAAQAALTIGITVGAYSVTLSPTLAQSDLADVNECAMLVQAFETLPPRVVGGNSDTADGKSIDRTRREADGWYSMGLAACKKGKFNRGVNDLKIALRTVGLPIPTGKTLQTSSPITTEP